MEKYWIFICATLSLTQSRNLWCETWRDGTAVVHFFTSCLINHDFLYITPLSRSIPQSVPPYDSNATHSTHHHWIIFPLLLLVTRLVSSVQLFHGLYSHLNFTISFQSHRSRTSHFSLHLDIHRPLYQSLVE